MGRISVLSRGRFLKVMATDEFRVSSREVVHPGRIPSHRLRARRGVALPQASGGFSDASPKCIDALTFARERLGFEADEVQAKLLSDGMHRVILNCTRQWGKSTMMAIASLYRAWSQPGSLVVVLSPSQRQSNEFLLKVRGFASRIGENCRGDGVNRFSLRFANGSRMVAVPDNPIKIRGFSAVSLLIFDEAAMVPDELYSTVRPMLATCSGDIWLMSTPYGKTGFFWKEWSEGGDQWTRISVTAEECPRISREFLEEERRSKSSLEFRREYCCEFVQPENAVFREEDILACLTDDEPLFPEVLWPPAA